MGHTKSDAEASSELEASQEDGFACLYCETSYGTRSEREQCRASHFENTDSIPVRTQKRNQGKNLLKDWKRGDEE